MKRELTNQELLDRYIHSVKTMLPPAKANDIAAEIRSNIESLVDDHAMQLVRELRPEEMSAILKQHGHPVSVSKRYHDEPRPSLIGPELLPFYWFALRSFLGLVFTILAIIAAFKVVRQPDPVGFLLQFGRNVFLAELVFAGIITAGFAVWEHMEFKYRYSEKWTPEFLAPVPPQVPQPALRQARPMVGIIGGVAWLIFWAITLFSPWLAWFWGGTGVFTLSAAADSMRLPLFLFALGWISQSWQSYTRFAAAEWRPYLRMVLNLAGLAFAIVLLRSGDLLVPGLSWNPSHSLDSLNQMLSGCLLVSCISSSLQLLFEVRRLLRRLGPGMSTPASISR